MAYDRRSSNPGPRKGSDRHGFDRGGDRRGGGYSRSGDGERRSWRDGAGDGGRREGGYRGRDERREGGYRGRDDRRDGGFRGRDERREGGFSRSGDGERRSWRDGDGSRREGGFRGRDERRDGGFRGRGGSQPRRQDRSGGSNGRLTRAPQRARVAEPPLPADVEASMLDASARRQLRALGRANAENVARHLVMLQRLLESDPEQAYQHARYACAHAGRVAVVRESAGIAAYLAGHYQQAVTDIRAARRLSGLDLHRAIEADCERALGRYSQALRAAAGADPQHLDDLEEAEIAMVVSGVRAETGNPALGLIVIEEAITMFRGDRETLRRMHSVRADRLSELGREDEAAQVRARIGITAEGEDEEYEEPEEEIVSYDLEEESAEEHDEDEDGAEDHLTTSDDDSQGAEDADEAEDVRWPAQDTTDDEDDDDEEDPRWEGSFDERVSAELDELLGPDDDAQETL